MQCFNGTDPIFPKNCTNALVSHKFQSHINCSQIHHSSQILVGADAILVGDDGAMLASCRRDWSRAWITAGGAGRAGLAAGGAAWCRGGLAAVNGGAGRARLDAGGAAWCRVGLDAGGPA